MNQMRFEYQEGYSQINPAVLNFNGRRNKADNSNGIGCSGEIILHHLKGDFQQKIGIDIDFQALKKAKTDYHFHDIDFICADGMNLPLKDNAISLIICNHVYEHLPNSKKTV